MVLIWSDVQVFARRLGSIFSWSPAEDTTLDNVHPVLHNLEITETEFTVLWEVLNVKKQISQGKAPEEPEILKCCDNREILLVFANKLLMNGEKPDQSPSLT